MGFDTFDDEVLVLKNAEELLETNPGSQQFSEAFVDILKEYKKLLKISRRIVRMSDRNEKGLITARKKIQAQQANLEEAHLELKRLSEHRLRTIVEATPVAIVISSLESGKIIYVNEITGPMLGLTSEQLLGRKAEEFYLHPGERDKITEILNNEGRVDHYELQIKSSDGSLLWGDISQRYITFNDEPCVLAACNDITHLKEFSQAASRFVPGEYLSFLNKKSLIDIHLGDHVSDEMTVMFSDLRSFTTISEGMTPQQNFNFINAYLGRVSPVIRDFNGFIVKYLGDGIMAIFPESADDAVKAGIETFNQVYLYNEHRQKMGRKPIYIGVGVNTGHMMVGMVGEQGRMQGDAFSDHVNLTSRLEGLTKYYSVSFIISSATRDALEDHSQYGIRFLDKVQVKGRQSSLDLYEVYDADIPEMRRLKQQTLDEYQQAMDHFFAKEFSEAQSLLFSVLQKKTKDKVAWHHLMSATHCLDNGVPESWTGVTVMTNK